MLSNARGAREYAKFRPTRHGLTAVAYTNEDEATIETLEVLTSGNKQIIPAQGETSNLVIKGFHFSNADSSTNIVSLRAGGSGKKLFTTMLAASGGNLDKNLVGRYWRLPLNKSLVVNTSGAGDVWVTIEYEVDSEPAEEAVTPTDALVITEGITKFVVTKAAVDSQSIAEAITGKAIVVALSDVLPIAESLANATTLSLSDAVIIVESEIEGTGVSGLADAITFAESLVTAVNKGLVDSESIAEAVANKPTLGVNDSIEFDESQITIVHGT